MLKIKDNVDLKELEKFGYELQEDWWNRPTSLDSCEGDYIYYKHVAQWTSIEIEVRTRIITEQQDDMFKNIDEEYIEDIIKADLVEKVDN